MRVTFAATNPRLASNRLRGIIPQEALAQLGVERGADIVVLSKHGWDWSDVHGFGKRVFDVCDDHFEGPWADHYLRCCGLADLVTCPTPTMAAIIKARTGRDAVVVMDPYEQPERAPKVGESLLWFGHWSNMPDLVRVLDDLDGCALTIVSNPPSGTQVPGLVQWSAEAMDAAFEAAGLVVIPTGKSMAKSPNRAVDSIRRGLFVVAGYLPAYSDLGIWIGDIRAGVEWALSHREEALQRIARSQAYVAEEYSPMRIAQQWKSAFESI